MRFEQREEEGRRKSVSMRRSRVVTLTLRVGVGVFFVYSAVEAALSQRSSADTVLSTGLDVVRRLLLPAAVLAAVLAWRSYRYHPVVLTRKAGARQVERSQHSLLHNVVEEICVAAGLPKPRVAIVDDPALNAFSVTGRSSTHAVIAFTTGLLGALDREELQGVVAHELAQAANRSEDYLYADATAVRLTRNPAGLRRALEKMASGSTIVHLSPRELRRHWLAYPDELSVAGARTVSGHSPLEERIAALREMETFQYLDPGFSWDKAVPLARRIPWTLLFVVLMIALMVYPSIVYP